MKTLLITAPKLGLITLINAPALRTYTTPIVPTIYRGGEVLRIMGRRCPMLLVISAASPDGEPAALAKFSLS